LRVARTLRERNVTVSETVRMRFVLYFMVAFEAM
jgi:hypothetical protein